LVPGRGEDGGAHGCRVCGKRIDPVSKALPVCLNCLRREKERAKAFVGEAHRRSREPFPGPLRPPRDESGLSCCLCVNACQIPEGASGYCGLRSQRAGRFEGTSDEQGSLSWYYDGLPTNCVADWVCPGGTGSGYPSFAHTSGPEHGWKNLAVFYHGCTFDCLFCQNWTHREHVRDLQRVSPDEVVEAVDERTSCICYFGGDPTPQLPHALEVSRRALKKVKGRILRICWETNGSMAPSLLDEMVSLSKDSGGCVKFDIKAWSESLHLALCGVTNRRTIKNFERAAQRMEERPEPPPLIVSTLLIPGYIDEEEVRQIARWIVSLNPNIPYALLAFHPQFLFSDLPTTSRDQALGCKEAAEREGLRHVRIGNMHLLS